MTLERAHWLVAALRVRVALARAQLALRGYNRFQPRVPAGVAEGGQWTADDGSGSTAERDDDRLRLAENETGRQKSVDLREEEMRGGHTLRKHVGKTDEELLAKVKESRRISTFYRYGHHRDGSFASLGDANYFVNEALERHPEEIDLVSSGRKDDIFIKERFGYRTGREAYTDGYIEPYLWNTYGVGILIFHDPGSSRGFRIHTAYPRNDKPENDGD